MFDVEVEVSIPLKIFNVESNNAFNAVDNVQKLLIKSFPLMVFNNYDEIKDKMTINLVDVRNIKTSND